MQLVFTTSDTFVGKAICYLTGEEMTHVAIYHNKMFLHSALDGVRIDNRKEFTSQRKILATVDVDSSRTLEEIHEEYGHYRYDYKALLWLGARYFAKKHLKLPFPKVNLWNITGMFTCTEFVTQALDGQADSLITPEQLYRRIKNNG